MSTSVPLCSRGPTEMRRVHWEHVHQRQRVDPQNTRQGRTSVCGYVRFEITKQHLKVFFESSLQKLPPSSHKQEKGTDFLPKWGRAGSARGLSCRRTAVPSNLHATHKPSSVFEPRRDHDTPRDLGGDPDPNPPIPQHPPKSVPREGTQTWVQEKTYIPSSGGSGKLVSLRCTRPLPTLTKRGPGDERGKHTSS